MYFLNNSSLFFFGYKKPSLNRIVSDNTAISGEITDVRKANIGYYLTCSVGDLHSQEVFSIKRYSIGEKFFLPLKSWKKLSSYNANFLFSFSNYKFFNYNSLKLSSLSFQLYNSSLTYALQGSSMKQARFYRFKRLYTMNSWELQLGEERFFGNFNNFLLFKGRRSGISFFTVTYLYLLNNLPDRALFNDKKINIIHFLFFESLLSIFIKSLKFVPKKDLPFIRSFFFYGFSRLTRSSRLSLNSLDRSMIILKKTQLYSFVQIFNLVRHTASNDAFIFYFSFLLYCYTSLASNSYFRKVDQNTMLDSVSFRVVDRKTIYNKKPHYLPIVKRKS